jgi:hypothetical protein
MNLTVGPHPSAVYWRRRALVAAPLLVILVTFTTCLASGSDGSPKQREPAAKQTGEPSPAPSAESPSPSPDAVVPSLPTGTSGPSAPVVSPSVSPSPAGPAACADKDLDLVATMEKTTFRVGVHPRFKLTVTNRSANQCLRDVGSGQQELSVLQGTRKLWSSDHCSPNSGTDQRTLFPGEKRTYWLDWSGRTSEESCPKTRSEVGAGSYKLVARLGKLVSKPVDFTITK